jgi:predicted ATPase
VASKDPRLIKQIQLTNLLSFGSDTPPLELRSLNVLIGPNSSGKSNFIESIALLQATPVSTDASNSNLRGVLRRGGGIAEWIHKGHENVPATLDFIVNNPKKLELITHRFALETLPAGYRLCAEQIEPDGPYRSYNQFQGEADIFSSSNGKRKLSKQSILEDLSVLAQVRDPDLYPELAYLAEVYGKIGIYRNWAFGRNTVIREAQSIDLRPDRLEEDFSNLGLILNRLQSLPKVKNRILKALQELYSGLSDLTTIINGRSIQVRFTEGEFSIPATRLSDGTLRYLCLLTILCDPEPPPLICIEEPELGLHPDILPKLADLLIEASTRTQLIVTTHSDVLIDALTEQPEAVIVCEKHDGKSTMTRLEKASLVHWLEDYRLGQLWNTGQIGGRRW